MQGPVRGEKAKAPRWRRIVGAVLVVVGCLLVPLSLSAVWVRNTLLDTDNYVSTVGPLADNPDVQHAIANRVTDALFANADVEAKVADALPPRADFLAGPVSDGVRTAINAATLRLAESDRFETLWENANRRAHGAVVNVLTGGGDRVSTDERHRHRQRRTDRRQREAEARCPGHHDLRRRPGPRRQAAARHRAVERPRAGAGVGRPAPEGRLGPARSSRSPASPAAIGLSRNRRRTIQRGALGVAFAVAVQLVLLKTGRNLYLDAVTTKKSTPGAAGAIWDQLTSFLRTSGITVLVIALADRVRRLGPRTLQRRRASPQRVEPGAALRRRSGQRRRTVARRDLRRASKNWLRGLGVAVAFIVLIVWNHPTALTVLGIAVLLLVYLAILELVSRSAAPSPVVDPT